MPTKLRIIVEPKEIKANPNRTYHFTISINTTAELEPGIYWLMWRCTFVAEGGGEGTGALTITVKPADA